MQKNIPQGPLIILSLCSRRLTDLFARFLAETRERNGRARECGEQARVHMLPASLEVYTGKPDGYTMVSDSRSSSSLLEVAMKNLPFKVLDRTFVAFTTASAHIIFANGASPIKTLKDLDAEVKRSP